jgi:argininosuccinate synthase
MKTGVDCIVLAYSGGLVSSASIPWLAERHGARIITVTLDLGQGNELEGVRDRALAIGAVRAHVLDVRDELANELVRAIKADATAGGGLPLVTAPARPLIAKKLVEIAAIEQATHVAHGGAAATGDADRFDSAIRALGSAVNPLAPVREWGMSRLELLEYAGKRNVSTPVTLERLHAIDATLWGRSVDCSDADPWAEPPEDLYRLTRASAACPGEPAYVELAFERGTPTAVNGVSMSPIDLIDTVGMIAGTHGVGRFDVLEATERGVTTREICEAPAAVVLHAAHLELQRLVTGGEAVRFSHHVSRRYADLLQEGVGFSLLRDALDGYVNRIQECVTGTIRVRLFRGDFRIVGRRLVEPPRKTTELTETTNGAHAVGRTSGKDARRPRTIVPGAH